MAILQWLDDEPDEAEGLEAINPAPADEAISPHQRLQDGDGDNSRKRQDRGFVSNNEDVWEHQHHNGSKKLRTISAESVFVKVPDHKSLQEHENPSARNKKSSLHTDSSDDVTVQESDVLMLPRFALQWQLDIAKEDLTHALHQHDAALRDVSLLEKERDASRLLFAQFEANPIHISPTAPVTTGKRALENGLCSDGKKICPGIHSVKIDASVECNSKLSARRTKHQVASSSRPSYEVDTCTPLARPYLGLASHVFKFEKVDCKPAPRELWREKPILTWTTEDTLKYLAEIGRRRVRTRTSILDISDDMVRQIMQNLSQNSLSRAISAGRMFLRSAFYPCYCRMALNRGNWFIGGILEDKYKQKLHVRWPPVRNDDRLFIAASTFLQKYIAFCSKNRRWFRVIASRAGTIAVATDFTARSVDLWTPFSDLSSFPLPLSPWTPSSTMDELLSAGLLPIVEESIWKSAFKLVLLFRAGNNIVTIKQFSTKTRLWKVCHTELPFPFSTSQPLEMPVNRNDLLYMLDRKQGRILTLNLELNVAGSFDLPHVPFVKRDQMLAKNDVGNPCWVVLSRNGIHTFQLADGVWTEMLQFPLPSHYYTCRFIGQSEDTGHVILICHEYAGCLNIVDGTFSNLQDVPPIKSFYCLALKHPCVDHFLLWP